jgi:hypothetical protein
MVLHRAGYRRAFFPHVFVEGGVSSGRPEVDWP